MQIRNLENYIHLGQRKNTQVLRSESTDWLAQKQDSPS